jgi:hypothetical protein
MRGNGEKMVKIYFADKKGEASEKYADIYWGSILKAYFLGVLLITIGWMGIMFVLFFLSVVFSFA